MSQMDGTPRIRQSASANVYSALSFIAFAALLTAVIFVWMKNVELTGDLPAQQNKQFKNPFFLVDGGGGGGGAGG
ncbi:MAG: hypothetical protein GC159_19825 [Phycisphaera sp.]|nr:hypothetical protein [Phycisphaera sp.]